MFLYHYFEKDIGAFQNLSDLSLDEATKIMTQIKEYDMTFAVKRPDGYLKRRRELEAIAREMLLSKDGKPTRQAPHYMVVEDCPWLKSWYKQGDFVKINISEFDVNTLSFSYGDLFPTFSPTVNDDKEYRRQVYTYDEILKVIEKYGLPQIWNPDGKLGPERYIEVQVWSDDVLNQYKRAGK